MLGPVLVAGGGAETNAEGEFSKTSVLSGS